MNWAVPIVGHPATRGNVVIGNDVWIGDGATIMSGVTIGDGAVLGARAVVVRDVAPYMIVSGNPAQPVKARFDDDIVALLLELRWWDLPVGAVREIAPILSNSPTEQGLRELIDRYRR